MKRILLSAFALITTLSAFAQNDFTGTYPGTLKITSPLTKEMAVRYQVEKGKSEEASTITLKGFTLANEKFGDIVVEDVPTSVTAMGCAFGKVEGKLVETTYGTRYTANLVISFEGESNRVEGNTLTIAVKIGFRGKDYHTTFTGNKQPTTAIRAIQADGSSAGVVYYDLSGRRVPQPAKGGLYVVNGKKVVMP